MEVVGQADDAIRGDMRPDHIGFVEHALLAWDIVFKKPAQQAGIRSLRQRGGMIMMMLGHGCGVCQNFCAERQHHHEQDEHHRAFAAE